jgi:drug/metabolite transporter (DMT)-like permease
MVYLVLAAIVWGSSFPTITYALGDISPFIFVVLRFLAAFLILLARYHTRADFKRLFNRDLILISIPNALAFILQFKAQELTTASKTALFINSSPVFVVLLAAIFWRERFGRRQLAAMSVALAGVVITSTRLEFSRFSAVNVGDVLCLIVGLSWALFILLSKRLTKRYQPYEMAQALYFWTAVMTLPLLGFEDVRFEWRAALPLLYLTIFPTILGYFLYLKGVRSVSSLAASIVILIEVVVAFVISYFFLGESFSPLESVGVAMVMAGVIMVLRKPPRVEPPEPHSPA